MRAVVIDRYGAPDVQRLEDVALPVPAADEVLVRVRATTVTRTDCAIRGASPFLMRFFMGLRRPREQILGTELAGEVEAVGAAVSEFAPGDHVFGTASSFRPGAHAEFVCVREKAPLAHIPSGLSFEDAAAVCDGAILALTMLEAVPVKGSKVLVYGASGSIGTALVQLTRHFGADVTAVCGKRNLALMGKLGADRAIDYKAEDFTRNGELYDVIFDAVGKHSFKRCKGSLKSGGSYVASDGLLNIIRALWTSRIGDRKVLFPIPPRYTKKNVLFLKQLIEAGKYRAVVDRCYPLEEVVEATTYVETHQKTGNVVLTVGHPAQAERLTR